MFVHDILEHIKYNDVREKNMSSLDSKKYNEDQRQSWNRVAHWLAKMVEDNRSWIRESWQVFGRACRH